MGCRSCRDAENGKQVNRCKKLWVDSGQKFYNKDMHRLLKEKDIKMYFNDIPVTALTSTLSDDAMKSMCEILNNPRVIKGTVNRKNIKLNILKYEFKRKKSADKANIQSWKPLASEMQKQIVDDYAIVYMDFKLMGAVLIPPHPHYL